MDTSASAQELWVRYREAGDLAVRDRLVVHYAPLVKYVAGRVRASLPPGVDQDDLISDGLLGLMGAMETFDLDRGLKFQTHAQPRIRGAIIDGLRASDWVPRQVREQIRAAQAATAALEHRLHRRPTESELAEELGISEQELARRSSQSSYATVSSADWDLADDVVTSFATDGAPDAQDGWPDGFLPALWGLRERDQIVVALYYWERMTLAEIGQVLGVSESRVSQLLSRATLELRSRVA